MLVHAEALFDLVRLFVDEPVLFFDELALEDLVDEVRDLLPSLDGKDVLTKDLQTLIKDVQR